MLRRIRWMEEIVHTGEGMIDMNKYRDLNPARDSFRVLLLLALFAITFGAVLLSTVLRGEWARSHITSFVACIGGGVFLATCLLDLLPDALESWEAANLKMSFPVVEASVAAGFMMVLSFEQIVLALRERGYLGGGHIHLHEHDDHEEEGEYSSHHSHGAAVEESSSVPPESMLSVVLLVMAISLHALFEGLALAVISDASKLVQVFFALIPHKFIVGFSLGVRLVQSGMKKHYVALCAFVLGIQVVVGGVCGISIKAFISGGKEETFKTVVAVLQGIACGTFLYITTFEIVPHELGKKGQRLTKLVFLFVGFMIVVVYMLICPETE